MAFIVAFLGKLLRFRFFGKGTSLRSHTTTLYSIISLVLFQYLLSQWTPISIKFWVVFPPAIKHKGLIQIFPRLILTVSSGMVASGHKKSSCVHDDETSTKNGTATHIWKVGERLYTKSEILASSHTNWLRVQSSSHDQSNLGIVIPKLARSGMMKLDDYEYFLFSDGNEKAKIDPNIPAVTPTLTLRPQERLKWSPIRLLLHYT